MTEYLNKRKDTPIMCTNINEKILYVLSFWNAHKKVFMKGRYKREKSIYFESYLKSNKKKRGERVIFF